ncbi:Putative protein [Zobellia galactanivorans]|uniref:Uncharacterized protein n=1 Tax=Zobellia galactanivorans (strain DSM 12802 / CCUG 47099 / CIP 106680 / NCIMB 13871 / Dsij) TaxID=63186 RepID=G0KZW9_ZOBGA|nr:Putative protein [Zobellia galactanivorans]
MLVVCNFKKSIVGYYDMKKAKEFKYDNNPII